MHLDLPDDDSYFYISSDGNIEHNITLDRSNEWINETYQLHGSVFRIIYETSGRVFKINVKDVAHFEVKLFRRSIFKFIIFGVYFQAVNFPAQLPARMMC